jgi:hypothetical protein
MGNRHCQGDTVQPWLWALIIAQKGGYFCEQIQIECTMVGLCVASMAMPLDAWENHDPLACSTRARPCIQRHASFCALRDTPENHDPIQALFTTSCESHLLSIVVVAVYHGDAAKRSSRTWLVHLWIAVDAVAKQSS